LTNFINNQNRKIFMKKSSEPLSHDLYHFIGIGGIGMSGLAKILLSRGKQVTGSDLAENYQTAALAKLGAKISIGHEANNVAPTALVVFSSDIPEKNPEFLQAKRLNAPLLHRSDVLARLTSGKRVLAVSGTHGKTTTSSLLAWTLEIAGKDPSYAIGGLLLHDGSNAKDGQGDFFVIEADESDASFLKYDWEGGIITNIDTDHLHHFGSMEKLESAFRDFAQKASSNALLFYCGDDPKLSGLSLGGTSYGFGENVELRATNIHQKGFTLTFDAVLRGKPYSQIELHLSGRHNVLNALGVFGLSLALGIPESAIRTAFRTFPGVKRRMEKKCDEQSVLIFDDYGHHPTEIHETLSALRAAVRERRIIAVFQPHRYSRMRYVMNEFGGVFDEADCVVVTDLYTAEEKPIEGVTTEAICEKVAAQNRIPSRYIPRKELVDSVFGMLEPHDVVIFFGAGDSTRASQDLAQAVHTKHIKKLTVGLFFGGMNCEHEVSCQSAKYIRECLRPELYDVIGFQIGLDGRIFCTNDKLEPCARTSSDIISPDVFGQLARADLFFPVLHGPFGEDGLIQGFFEMLRRPYVGCDVRAAAVSMDKALTKQIAEAHGIRTAPFFDFDIVSWQEKKKEYLAAAREKFQLPVFVKPTHLGSSVGITKVEEWERLEEAITRAFCYDTHVLVEQGIVGREIEFAILGNFHVQVASPGEVLTGGKVYSYEAKYGENSFSVSLTPELTPEQVRDGLALAERMYREVGCSGLARIDFFLTPDGTFWVNEINPIPGFTKISLYPKAWARSHPKDWLIDELIILARARFRLQEKTFCFSCKNLKRE
jgi:UDP-N-acetylmuramate--alanine ligase